jgi:hypothetical protein
VNQVPVISEPVFAGVLAHGRNRDAISEGHFANRKRSEESGHPFSIAVLPNRPDAGNGYALGNEAPMQAAVKLARVPASAAERFATP